MASSTQAFSPANGGGVTVVSSTSTSVTKFDTKKRSAVCVSNLGTDLVYVAFGDSSKTATVADFIVFGGSQVVISKDPHHTHIAIIASANTPSIHVIAGEGL